MRLRRTLHPAAPAGSGEPGLPVEIEWEPETGRFRARVPGGELEGEAVFGPEGEGLLRLGERVRAFWAVRSGAEIEVWLDGELYRFAPEAPGPGAPPAAARTAALLPPGGEIRAPMPGRVLQLLVEPGARVDAQEPLALLESMKVQMTIPAPAAGRVAAVLCHPGELVELGAVLFRIEAEEGA